MQSGRIDVHGHLLPGVDDGCPSIEDSIECARILVENDYTHAFCTPHVWPALPANNIENIRQGVMNLQRELDSRQIPLTVIPGGEINILWGWPSLGNVPGTQIVTYGFAGKYVLFDFWAERMQECIDCMQPAIRHLQSLGLKLVLGHPERIAALHSDPEAVEWFSERGVMLQMNTWCLTDPPDKPTYQTAVRLLTEGRYFLLGTDLHNAASMPPRMRGLQIAEQIVGSEEVRKLTVTHPRLLMPEEQWQRWESELHQTGVPSASPSASRRGPG